MAPRKRRFVIQVKTDLKDNELDREFLYIHSGWGGIHPKDDPMVGPHSKIYYIPTNWWRHEEGRDQVLWSRLQPFSKFNTDQRIAIWAIIVSALLSAIAIVISIIALLRT